MQTNTQESDARNVAAQKPPPISQFFDWKPTNLLGFLFVGLCSSLTAVSLFLSTWPGISVWLLGQALLALALLQWFALLHEAGHKTLFRSSRLNFLVGHLSGFFAGFPFECWKRVHAVHHRWTGWQDLDATTAKLVPRQRPIWIRLVVIFCWRFWIPIFSIIYRLDNYWNLPRLRQLFSKRRSYGRFVVNVVLLLASYSLLVYLVGPLVLLRMIGLGLLLSLMMEDILILSQHTHVPMLVSDGETVDPIPPLDQEIFTRSLTFPTWFSRLILLNLDAHELHHMYVQVPGYYLDRIHYVPHNEMSWWQWLVRSKRIRGDVLLFQNRDQTGLEI